MKNKKITAPYGTWKSPITADLLVSATLRLDNIRVSKEGIFWTEGRPSEKGRMALVRQASIPALRGAQDSNIDFTPDHINIRTQVHEYGGLCFAPFEDKVYYVNFTDQRIYFSSQTSEAIPITVEGHHPENDFRYADLIIDPLHRQLICVCEDHTKPNQEPVSSIIAIELDAGPPSNTHHITTLVSGNDFYASPRISPDGHQFAWITWNHPNMPWDESELMLGSLNESGTVANIIRVAGGEGVSVFQPEWIPNDKEKLERPVAEMSDHRQSDHTSLIYVSDESGWWNLYQYKNNQTEDRYTEGRYTECLLDMNAEFGLPQWVFGMSTYAIQSSSKLYCTYCVNGEWKLAQLHIESKTLEPIPTEFSDISSLSCYQDTLVFKAGSPTSEIAFYTLNTREDSHDFNAITLLKNSSDFELDEAYLSKPQHIQYSSGQTGDGPNEMAHAFYYPPQNKDYEAAKEGHEELPPLRVLVHGGPTGMSSSVLSLNKQYWTSRGFAVLDVNYRGSTGFGRAYRQLLNDKWGIADYEDCLNGALYLVSQKQADPNRLTIIGGSAGGYTVLCALTFSEVFSAGASYYGISDLEALAKDTHKFESRYLDRLIGPYPERKDIYEQRSPIHFTEQLSCPVIVFQGLDDRVVPPNQAEMMVESLKSKNIPVAYVSYEGEGHGFREAKNIKRSLEAELSFFGQIFGFTPADTIESVEIMR